MTSLDYLYRYESMAKSEIINFRNRTEELPCKTSLQQAQVDEEHNIRLACFKEEDDGN